MRGWLVLGAVQTVLLAVLGHTIFLKARPAASGDKGASCGLQPLDEYVLVSRNVVLPAGTAPAAVHVRGGRIVGVAPLEGAASLTAAALARFNVSEVVDHGDLLVSPGLVDTHVHWNEPGREHWEGFESGSQAAAAGGTTTVVLMPLNQLPAIVNGELMRRQVAASEAKLWVDAGFWGGLVPANAANATTLAGLLDAGALGFKSFMSPSADFGSVGAGDIAAALPQLKGAGAPFYVHAELPDDTAFKGDVRSHASWEASRPPRWEEAAVSLLLRLLAADGSGAPAPGFRLHIAHLSSASVLPLVAAAKAQGVPLSVETCPHYLLFASEAVPPGDTRFKCAPPLRGAANQAGLWAGLAGGLIDSLASDHSPSPPEMKRLADGDFSAAWGGVAGLQYSLPAAWTAARRQGLGPGALARWLSAAPAALAGLGHRKGAIAPGLDADFVVWDPEAAADTSPGALRHRHKLTPYAGAALRGRVAATYVRGQLVFREGAGVSPAACGAPLLRGRL